MSDDIFRRLQSAQSDEERQWLALEFSLQNQTSLVKEAVWAASVPHWFDGKFLGVLLNRKDFESSDEYKSLLELSFIELYPDRGFNVHERTRNLVLNRLWAKKHGLFNALTRQAFGYCTPLRRQDIFWLSEYYYHGLLVQETEVLKDFIEQSTDLYNHFEYDKVEILLRPVLEAVKNNLIVGKMAGWAHLRRGMLDIVYNRYQRAKESLEQALKCAGGDPKLTADCHKSLGDVYYWLSENALERTSYEEALRLYREIGDRIGEATCIQALGDLHLSLSEYGPARDRYEEAKTIFHEIGERTGEAICVRSIGDVHYWLSENESARQRYEEALVLYHSAGDRNGEALCLRSLGDVNLSMAEYDSARTSLEKAIAIYQELGNRFGKANCVKSLGDVYYWLSENALERTSYEEALRLYREIGDRIGEATCIQALGDLHLSLSEYGPARDRYEEAKTIFHEIGERTGEAICVRSIGDVHYWLSENESARQRYEEALVLYHSAGDRNGEALCLRSLGDVNLSMAEYDSARTSFEKAIAIYQELGDHFGEANCVRGIGDVELNNGRYARAKICYEKALGLYYDTGNCPGQAACIQALGDLYGESGDVELANVKLNEALSKYKVLHLKDGEAACLTSMGNLLLSQKRYDEARHAFDDALSLFTDGYIYRCRVNLFVTTKQFELADYELNKAESLEPQHPYVALQRGRISLRRNNFAEAIEHLKKAIETLPGYGVYYLHLALALLFDQRLEEAQPNFDSGLKRTHRIRDIKDVLEEIDQLVNIYGGNSLIEEMQSKLMSALARISIPNEH